MYLLSCKHSKWGFYVKVVSESTKDLGGINCTVSGHAECLSSILVSNISERRFDSKWCLDSGLYIRNVLMSNDYASMHHVFSPSAEMKTTEWLNISHLICVRVLSMSTPFELAFAKSLRARSKATRHRPLICWIKIDKSHPVSRPKKKALVSFRVRLWCWGKGNGINPFVKITRPFTTSPKSLKTDGILSQVQIITMMSSTVHCRGKVRWPEQKPPHRLLLQQHASCFVAELSWAWWTKIWKQTVEKHHVRQAQFWHFSTLIKTTRS